MKLTAQQRNKIKNLAFDMVDEAQIDADMFWDVVNDEVFLIQLSRFVRRAAPTLRKLDKLQSIMTNGTQEEFDSTYKDIFRVEVEVKSDPFHD